MKKRWSGNNYKQQQHNYLICVQDGTYVRPMWDRCPPDKTNENIQIIVTLIQLNCPTRLLRCFMLITHLRLILEYLSRLFNLCFTKKLTDWLMFYLPIYPHWLVWTRFKCKNEHFGNCMFTKCWMAQVHTLAWGPSFISPFCLLSQVAHIHRSFLVCVFIIYIYGYNQVNKNECMQI